MLLAVISEKSNIQGNRSLSMPGRKAPSSPGLKVLAAPRGKELSSPMYKVVGRSRNDARSSPGYQVIVLFENLFMAGS